MDTLPLSATDNGDGTATLKVDTELTATIDPAGLATSAKQDTGNSSLNSIDGKLPTLVGGKIPVDASVSIDSIDIGDVDIKEFPAGNLGQQAKAASLSVAPATDITDATYIGDIKFGESLPSGTALLGKVSIDQVTANANEIVVKSITAGPLPDTSASDLSHIHAKVDNLNVGDQAKAASISVTPATDITDGRYIGNVKVDSSALPTGAATSANQTTQIAATSNDGSIYENQNLATADTARRFETSQKKLKDVIVQVSGYAQLFGDSANQRYRLEVGGWIGFQKCDISTLYFKNAAAGQNGTVNIIGVEE